MVQSEENSPGLHPKPPEDISQRQLPTICIKNNYPYLLKIGKLEGIIDNLNAPFFRVHLKKYGPLHFGCSGNNRFDDPHRKYGVLYLGCDESSSFRETVKFNQKNLIDQHWLKERCISKIGINRGLTLVDLTANGLTQINADGRLSTGSYQIAQLWSLAFYHHPSQPDGIYYRSRKDPSLYCIALFDRIKTKTNQIIITSTISFLDKSYQHKLGNFCETYKFGIPKDDKIPDKL